MDSIYHSFNQWLQPVKFTSSGRPELCQDEIELLTSQKTSCYDGETKLLIEEVCIFTSQRLIFLPKDTTKSISFPLLNYTHFTTIHPWFKTPKILFHLRFNSNDSKFTTPEEIDQSFLSTTQPVQPQPIFTIGIKDSKIFTAAQQQLTNAHTSLISQWRSKLQQQREQKTVNYGTTNEDRVRNVGVAGILEQRKEKIRQQETQLSEAGTDLDSLMKHAQQVTLILEKLSQRALAQQQRQEEKQRRAAEQQLQQSSPNNNNDPTTTATTTTSSPTPTSTNDDLSQTEQDDFTNVIEQMGFISPVTKQSSGNRFHEELSRQLFDFAQRPVELSHGNIGLIDLYCLYNRARGTELVSPQDVLKACQLWEKLFPSLPQNNQNSNRVSLRLKQLKSGGYIIQSSLYNENSERLRIHQYIFQRNCGLSGKGAIPLPSDVPDLWKSTTSKGVSILEISQFFKISLQLATEQLVILEKASKIIRDSSAAVTYYHNFFLSNTID